MLTRSKPVVLVSGYHTPEGPVLDRDGNLYFVNWATSSVIKVDPDGKPSEFVNTGGIPAGLAFHMDGTLYVADEGEKIHGVLKVTRDGKISVFVDSYQGRPLNGANDLVFDPNGNLYFSDPWGSSAQKPIGCFYRAFPDSRLELIDTGLAFPNGVALNSESTHVFLAETHKNRILRYEIKSDGCIGKRNIFAVLDDGQGPDGMDFDAEGNLYVAHYGAQHIDVFNSSGRVIERIIVPGKNPTNVHFGGPESDTLYITEVETGSVYKILMNVKGQRLFGEK